MRTRKAREYYKARGLNGHGDLALHMYSGDRNTLQGVEEIIDKANAGAVEAGYKPEQFQITEVEVYTYYEDGVFESEETYEGVVEVYPEEV